VKVALPVVPVVIKLPKVVLEVLLPSPVNLRPVSPSPKMRLSEGNPRWRNARIAREPRDCRGFGPSAAGGDPKSAQLDPNHGFRTTKLERRGRSSDRALRPSRVRGRRG
jgi:hypothetical protein